MIHSKKLTRGLTLLLIITLMGGVFVVSAFAKKYPNKPVTIIIPFGPSGSTGLSVNRVIPFLSKELGQRVVAVSKKGAGGRIGATAAYRARPDGYTLLAHNLPTAILGQLVFKAKYDLRKFVQIYGWIKEPRVVAVHKDSPYRTFEDLMKASKQKELSASVVGFGVTDHVQSVLLKKAGLNHRIIPFGSGGKAVKALLGKNVDFAMPAAISAKPHYDDGRIRVLAVTSKVPFPAYPGVPSLKYLGYKDIVLYTTRGLMGPPGMDPGIARIVARAMDKAVHNPEFLAVAKKGGEPVLPMNTAEWKKVIEEGFAEVEKILPLMKADMAKKK